MECSHAEQAQLVLPPAGSAARPMRSPSPLHPTPEVSDGERHPPRTRAWEAVITADDPNVTHIPFSAWTLLPPADDVCAECARPHDPAAPHDQQSLYYQYAFRNTEARAGREERWPSWRDAMRHCQPAMRAAWTAALGDHGIVVDPEPAA